ncbi:protein sprouty-like [Ornithodoros turicata]|uniref:Putative sprouty n=1 Tax=Ornithodoros turicata TaxID=34597 RepID=A0A2R5L456_9ACAR
MAQNGGSRQQEVITLGQPRPGTARRQNEYIDTPLRPAPPAATKVSRRDVVAVTSQPLVTKKEKPPVEPAVDLSNHEDSIICKRCGRCRCDACQNPRPLPSRWICNDKVQCSAHAMVDYCSCVCCVKGLFYHWAKDYDLDTDVSCADKPCSCGPHRRCSRWCCLGVLSFVLPCLCLYWPLRGCVRACEACYSSCSSRGCQCDRTPERPSKRLLEQPSGLCE